MTIIIIKHLGWLLLNRPIIPEITPGCFLICLPNNNILGLLVQEFLQAGWPSCHPQPTVSTERI